MTGFLPQTLTQLFARIPVQVQGSIPDMRVTGITLDSRQVRPGYVFVALSGGSADGHRFIPDAVDRGAMAVVGSRPPEQVLSPIPYLRVEDPRRALAFLSSAFYNFPAREMTVIGVTGTDGKTTTCNLIYEILLAAGLRAGIISTVNATIGSEVLDTGFHVTTPEAPDVQRYLARMAVAGLSHVVLEATSHGLDQHRVTGCEFDIGVVTNITHEHLDYHGSYEAYRAAKTRLFTMLAETAPKARGNPRLAVLNLDDASYDSLRAATPVRQLTYSLTPKGSLSARAITYHPGGLRYTAVGPGFEIPVECRLEGEFNVSNSLAAIAATVVGLGVEPDAARRGIANLRGVPGRMEPIDMGQNFLAVVDFAHTPNALKRALEAARGMTRGRVIAVFGSAGLRDRQKRRMMAEVSAGLADCTVLTAEDPRTEDLTGILGEMAQGVEARGGLEGQTFWRVPNRGEALRVAVRLAQPGDLVIACGKGHEQSMCFGETEYAWDDRTALRAALAEHLGIPGPGMPFLPT